jgi:hypothetical protein
MKKQEFINNYITPWLDETDKPGNRQLWNNSIDMLIKDGELPQSAANWVKTPLKYYGESKPKRYFKPIYSTIEGMHRATYNGNLTLESILHSRIYHTKHGWITAQLAEPAKDKALQECADIIGGRNRNKVLGVLRYSSFSHWSLSRFMYKPGSGWSYCAGQDYPSELATIRKFIYNQ